MWPTDHMSDHAFEKYRSDIVDMELFQTSKKLYCGEQTRLCQSFPFADVRSFILFQLCSRVFYMAQKFFTCSKSMECTLADALFCQAFIGWVCY